MTADEMPKVYELPGLEPAPSSTLQSLLRRLMEYADWTAARGVLDCLNDDERHTDLRAFREWFARAAQEHAGKPSSLDKGVWQHRCRLLTITFFFDLFSFDAAIEGLLSAPVTDRPVFEPDSLEGMGPPDSPLVAECDIPAGAAVALDHHTGTVRLHPTQPTEGGAA